ncbi:MAG: tyrosine recombinase XerD [Actinobacteria bacterium]|nr:tyrosine recombinase XerD [Actinomycetota bacterium]
MSLSDGLDEYLAALRAERGLAPATIEAYRGDLRQYLGHLDGADPDPGAVSGFVRHLDGRGLAATTIARKIAAVRGFHRFLVAEGMADADPTLLLDSPRRGRSLPRALTIDEMIRLVEAPDTSTALGRRDRALLEFMYATGARVAETVGLDQMDLDLANRTALVTGKGGKQRLVPLGSHAVDAIHRWLPDRLSLRTPGRDPGAIFLNARGGRLSRQAVFDIVRKHAECSGIARGKVSPHVLRHSMATHMVEGGADLRTVQELLGHASITTTQIYTSVSPRHLLEVYVLSHPRG